MQIKPAKARYWASHMACLWLLWPLEKLNYFLEGCVFEFITALTTFKSLLRMKAPNRNILRWQVAIQEYKFNMTMLHKYWNTRKNADGISRLPLPNNLDNPAYIPKEDSPQIPIEGISVTFLNTTFIEEVRTNFTQDTNCRILCQLFTEYSKDNSLIHALDEIWKKPYYGGRFDLLDGILYHRTKHTCVMTVVESSLINPVLKECHNSPFSGHLSDNRTREKANIFIWWPMCQKDGSES
ncbi:hypothetical protein O181_067093 [Austropuccinia psidii MF-1]|uniref:Uncharacterized protein n=1 Tax=Austropuccinia psidii MF-1 TaxID=1389203 RepID=A0A9Q3I473_9BASI|nr:hypothetical protein [Austropuccinia psidii MF-1]